jgi:glycosyltransferase involved in cell wall biosynthesis
VTDQDQIRLRIAQVAPVWASVPPTSYGGAEIVVHWLTEELVRRGHEVTLFATGDSRTAARLAYVCEVNLLELMAKDKAYQYEPYANAHVIEAIRASADFDLLHCHLGAATIPVCTLARCPVVHTVHAGLSVDEFWLLDRYPEVPITAISRSQIAEVSEERSRTMPVVYHGCEFDRYQLSTERGRHLAFLGRMGPHKNPVDAIRIAKAAGLPIVLAGRPQDASEERYFNEMVKPLIDDKNVVYRGALSFDEKVEFLREAMALVFPIRWDEHFGLVMIEAMACGTPVLACRRGSVPEVVDPGRTGFYADSPDALIDLLPATLALDRKTVREHARGRFSHTRMVDDYLALYRVLARRA